MHAFITLVSAQSVWRSCCARRKGDSRPKRWKRRMVAAELRSVARPEKGCRRLKVRRRWLRRSAANTSPEPSPRAAPTQRWKARDSLRGSAR